MIREEDDFAGSVRETGPLLGYVHACENQRGIPGRGQVPWHDFFQALADINYQGCGTIESFDPNMERIAKLLLHLAQIRGLSRITRNGRTAFLEEYCELEFLKSHKTKLVFAR